MSNVVAGFFKSKWSEEQIKEKLEEALTMIETKYKLDSKKVNSLRTKAKEILKL